MYRLDFDLAEFSGVPENGTSPAFGATDPVGVLAGLNASLIALLGNFSPGNLGVCVIEDKVQLQLSVPHWAEWTWLAKGVTSSTGAGGTGYKQLATVPDDERWMLDYIEVDRNSGDNEVDILSVTVPDGYTDGNGYVELNLIGTPAALVQWPDPNQISTSSRQLPMPPGGLLLEPGTIIELHTAGVGVAISTFNFDVLARRTKIIRAMVP